MSTHTSYKSFTYTKVTEIEEQSCTLYELSHESGAQVVHIACDDPENVFCLGLKTWPDSGNGAPHILEHTVLCGSEKYPVKDPFFAMTRRSLNTFMNAFTGPDFTCYPAASMNEQDFYNLLSVYCDAVFFPKLNHLSFLQEGHRFEFENKSDASTPLTYQGIVYNEMKGSLSSPDSRMWRAVNKALLPDLPYAFNSGGDPEEIPDLTYQGLKDFHKTYYHPGRCMFYFYGNLPIEKHLDFIESHVLSRAEAIEPLPPLPKQKRFSKPVEVVESFPTQEETKAMGIFSWLTCAPTEVEDSLALSLLDNILTDHDASPLKRALLDSGLCSAADGYLDSEMSEIPYMIVCKGCEEDNIPKLKDLILDTLKKVCETGINPEDAKNALHQIEFERLEIGGGGMPFGLNLFFRSAALKAYGGAPEMGLKFYEAFEALAKKIEDPMYLCGLIKKYLIENPHRVQLTFKGELSLAEKESEAERKKLDAIKEDLSEKQKEEIIHTADQLKTFQLQTEAQSLDCLPKIEVSDVSKEPQDFELIEKDGIYHSPVFTNHIIYASMVLDLPDLTLEELAYAQLYTSLLTELGAGEQSYLETLLDMQAHVGGISASMSLYPQRGAPDILKPALIMKGKALWRNREQLFSQMKRFTEGRCDEAQRIKELILQIYTYMQQRVNQSAMSFATQLATSHLSHIGSINSHWQGLNYFKFIEKLAKNIDAMLPDLMEKFETLKPRLFHMQDPEIVVSCDEKSFEELSREDFYGLRAGERKPLTPFTLKDKLKQPENTGRIISSPVAFTAMGQMTIDSSDDRAPLISIASELFDNLVLHPKIREQGGAYGSGSSYNPNTGSFYFYGFRDPNLSKTIDAFKSAPKAIAAGEFTESDLDEAKLGLIQAYDSPLYPGSRAMAGYNWKRANKPLEYRKAVRTRILQATKDEVIEAATLIDTSDGCIASFASEEFFKKDTFPLHILPF